MDILTASHSLLPAYTPYVAFGQHVLLYWGQLGSAWIHLHSDPPSIVFLIGCDDYFKMPELPSSTQILLACRNPTAPLTPYDGRVGAVIGNYIYTTPNETFIPLFVHGNREVYVRKDYRYGPDDHTLWPQPYSSIAPHLAAIPRKSTDSNHPLAPLWSDPQDSDFIKLSQGTVASGIGKLASPFIGKIEPIMNELHTRFLKYAKSLGEAEKPNRVASTLDRISRFAFLRLSSLSTNWIQIRFTLTELQRLLLELHGCLDYIEIFKPIIDGTLLAPSNPSTPSTIGTFTTNIRVVEEFSLVGIPVWFIRPHNASGFGNNVLEEVKPIHYKNTLVMEKAQDFPIVFKGEHTVDSFVVVTHVLQFSRYWLSTPNPFAGDPHASSSSQSSSIMRGPDGQPLAKKQKHAAPLAGSSSSKQGSGRDKFQALTGPMMPFAIPAWVEQLRSVDQSQPPAVDRIPRGGFYVYPDPGLFISPETDQKRQRLIEQYCRIANLWLSRIQESPGLALNNQQWRDLLSIDFSLPPAQWTKGESRAAARHQYALNQLLPPGRERRAIEKDEPYELPQTGELYPTGILPPHTSIRKLIFLLYSLNFRSELVALDRIAHEDLRTAEAILARESELVMLFPNNAFYIPTLTPPNVGLVADTLRERIPYLRSFAHIMSSWKGDKPHIFRLRRHHSGADEDIPLEQAEELEREVAKFYCQNFFNYFRRAAQIPYQLYPPSRLH